MLKQHLIKVVLAIALVLGGYGVWTGAANTLGLPQVPAAHACTNAGTSGGGC